MHHYLAGRNTGNGRIIRFVQTDKHIIPGNRLKSRQCIFEHCSPHLGAAPAAAHGDGGYLPDGVLISQAAGNILPHLLFHVRQTVVLAHEAAVNPVFPLPHPAPFQRPPGA